MADIFSLILAFITTGLVSFLLFYVMLKQRDLATVETLEKKHKGGLKRLKKELKAAPWSWQNVVMSKWVAFGGGFYGVMAVLTYVAVELVEVVEFFTSEGSLFATLADLGFGDLINFFINSLMNFIIAVSWPIYWLKNITGYSPWVWFVVVYAAYLSGQFMAKNTANPYRH